MQIQVELLIFCAAHKYWGIDPFHLLEIGDQSSYPQATFVDVGKEFNLPSSTTQTRALLLKNAKSDVEQIEDLFHEDTNIAILVDSIVGVETFPPSDIYSLPTLIAANLSYPLIQGVVLYQKSLIPIIQGEKIRDLALLRKEVF